MLTRMLEPEAMDTPDEARVYDAMDHSAVNDLFVADFLAAHGPCRGGAILDVGTGPARIPIALCRADPRANVLGIDLARHMLDRAQSNVEEAGLSDRIKLEHVDAKGVPYPDGQFEAVISNSIVHHVADPTLALAEMVRLVAPGDAVRPRPPPARGCRIDRRARGGLRGRRVRLGPRALRRIARHRADAGRDAQIRRGTWSVGGGGGEIVRPALDLDLSAPERCHLTRARSVAT